MNTSKDYKYHCQHQAESFARAILPIPSDYPLSAGLTNDFRIHFSKLCELAKSIYLDIARQPEAYGLMLVDIDSRDHNLARDGYRTIHRFVDILGNLAKCGELRNHQLIINTNDFKNAVKKGAGLVSGPIPKYHLILSRLVEFGFSISGFEGRPFDKDIGLFTLEYPHYPELIDAIKVYCDCWETLKIDRSGVKIDPKEYHHHYYRFDYKITANREEITMIQWLKDEADYLGYTPQQKEFSVAFYKQSLQYKGVRFDGDYIFKSKRIARIWEAGYIALGETSFLIQIKLRNMDKYMNAIIAMPNSIRHPLMKDSCRYCGFQGSTAEYCKYRIFWTHEKVPHVGCSHVCFEYDDFDIARVSDYWKLLEMEYGLERN